MSDKKNISFVLWSGGLDSTYMIQKLLDEDLTRHVYAGYVEVQNNENKTAMETKATDNLEKIFNRKYPGRFNYMRKVYSAYVRNVGGWMGLKQMPVWMAAIMSATPNDTKEICLGYVMNDCAISYLNEFKGVFRAYSKLCWDNKFPKIRFPLSKINKEEIISKIDVELKNHVVWCENPKIIEKDSTRTFEACGHCVACGHSPIMKGSAKKCSDFVEVFNVKEEPKLVQDDFFKNHIFNHRLAYAEKCVIG
jgi:7-cyano-7-deazaguanine synthase in queuosine biosynthesis